jgi:hypothetical protein
MINGSCDAGRQAAYRTRQEAFTAFFRHHAVLSPARAAGCPSDNGNLTVPLVVCKNRPALEIFPGQSISRPPE